MKHNELFFINDKDKVLVGEVEGTRLFERMPITPVSPRPIKPVKPVFAGTNTYVRSDDNAIMRQIGPHEYRNSGVYAK